MKRLKGEIERMKKVMKRVITACLAFAMILALVTPASVEAATKNESLHFIREKPIPGTLPV